MILTKENFDGLIEIQLRLTKIINDAIMSDLEEQHENKFEKLIKKNDRAFELVLIKRRKQMPKKYKFMLTEQWFKDHTRLRPNGVYEVRCSINKVPISGSSKDLETAIANFIENLVQMDRGIKKKEPDVKRVLFNEFAEKWFELVKKPTVKPNTYQSYLDVYKTHIISFMNGIYIDELTAMRIQPLFSALYEKKQTKTADYIKLILNQIFKAAITERLISVNPMNGVKLLKHKSKNGTALTYDEEFTFLQKLEGSEYKLTFALMLFGGMRRGELASVVIEGDFLKIQDGKQRLSDIPTLRKVPITPMLERYLKTITPKELKTAIGHNCDKLSRVFNKFCPSHHLHELRHTFITRCQECGVPREVVSVWAGHAADSTMTSNVYTHFSEKFMLAEAKKVDYYNRYSD